MFYIEMEPGLELSLIGNATERDFEVFDDSSLVPTYDIWGQKTRFNFKFRFEGVFYVIYENVYKVYNSSGSFNLVIKYTDFNRNSSKTMLIQDRKFLLWPA